MKQLPYYAVTAQQVATHPVKLLKLEATLNASATAGLFLQLHDSNTTPADGQAPLKCWPAAECGFKEFEMGELVFSSGLYLCLSTTAATKTLATGGSDLIDILNVELIDPEAPTGTSIAGDRTTTVAALTVWADGAGPKKLMAIEFWGTGYLMLFAKSPSNGDIPLATFTPAIGWNYWNFGANGRDVFSQDADGTNRNGCYLAASNTADTFTAAASNKYIKAEYK